MDFRLEGPAEAKQIIKDNPACETAPNGTGSSCSCPEACANYALRRAGFKPENFQE